MNPHLHQPLPPIVELADPTTPNPAPRRSGKPTRAPLHPATLERIIAVCGGEPAASVRLAYDRGIQRGLGTMGALVGCEACKARAMGPEGCLDCGAEKKKKKAVES